MKRRRLITRGAIGLVIALALGLPAALYLQNQNTQITPKPEIDETGTFPERVAKLDRVIGQNLQTLIASRGELSKLAAEIYAAEISERYGLAYDPILLSQQLVISNNSQYRRNVLEADGCINRADTMRTNDAALTNPAYPFAYINAEAIHRDAKGILSPTKIVLSTANHEFGHHIPEENRDKSAATKFQSAIPYPGWTITGIKGFALVVEVPAFSKTDKPCTGRPGYDLTFLEEAFVESDKNAACRRAGIYLPPVEIYKGPTEKLEGLILGKLTQADRRRVGIMHKTSDLEGILGFYKQNFNATGTLGDLYVQINNLLR